LLGPVLRESDQRHGKISGFVYAKGTKELGEIKPETQNSCDYRPNRLALMMAFSMKAVLSASGFHPNIFLGRLLSNWA
jgi:hypothetical protein